MRSLDGQVQEIKSDVLKYRVGNSTISRSACCIRRTHRFLCSSSSQRTKSFRLDAVQVTIDGELATHHIYSFKELEALQKGGVQRIYTGNIPTGNHQISVTFNGKLKSGKDFSESGEFTFLEGCEAQSAWASRWRSRASAASQSRSETGREWRGRSPLTAVLLPLLLITASVANADELGDAWFGEALYYAHQGDYFGALERLDTEVRQHTAVDERNLDTLYAHFNDAEFFARRFRTALSHAPSSGDGRSRPFSREPSTNGFVTMLPTG